MFDELCGGGDEADLLAAVTVHGVGEALSPGLVWTGYGRVIVVYRLLADVVHHPRPIPPALPPPPPAPLQLARPRPLQPLLQFRRPLCRYQSFIHYQPLEGF